jgi:hypothetical protein
MDHILRKHFCVFFLFFILLLLLFFFIKHLMDEWTVMNKRSYLSHTQSLSPNWLKTKDMGSKCNLLKVQGCRCILPIIFPAKITRSMLPYE